jgi:hypothetical protein
MMCEGSDGERLVKIYRNVNPVGVQEGNRYLYGEIYRATRRREK